MASRFAWYELMTSDPKAAAAFYGKVVGWTAHEMPMPGMTYTLMKSGDADRAGVMAFTPEAKQMGAPPNWLGYVGVANVDQSAEQVKERGGKLFVPPTDIPNIGRFAVAADPQGAVIALFQAPAGATMPPVPALGNEPGRIGWHELYAGALEPALAFYSALFGWQKGEAMDMGAEMGTYQMITADGEMLAGAMNKPAAIPAPPFWLYYFNIENIDAAMERVKANGGSVMMGPAPVPDGRFFCQARDPQGAVFGLLGPK